MSLSGGADITNRVVWRPEIGLVKAIKSACARCVVLHEAGYSLQSNRKREGNQHPTAITQFEFINASNTFQSVSSR